MKKTKSGICLTAIILLTLLAIITLFSFPQTLTSNGIETEVALADTNIDLNTGTSTSIEIKELEQITQPSLSPILPKVLLDIAWCESRDDQRKVGRNYRTRIITLEDGSTTTEKYVWSKDIGRFQVNDYYHAETAKKMGMDIYTVEGNTQYALFLYNSNGTRDWNPSKECWTDIDTWRAREKSYY